MLLVENRVSQVKEKYDIPIKVWEPMVSGSAAIAPNQKYLEWIARVWSEKVSTPENIKIQKIDGTVWSGVLNGTLSTVEEFDRVRPNLKKKDLYQYSNRQEVVTALQDWEKEKTRNIETHSESEVVYEDDRFKVVVPNSHTASCYYGAGTRWCTASLDNPGHFTNYDKEGKLFYILDKTAPTSNQYYKVALNKTYKGGNTYYDARDSSIADTTFIPDIIEHPNLLKRINEFFAFTYKDEIAKISDAEKQKELDRIAREAEWAARRREREQRLDAAAANRSAGDEWNYSEGTGTVGIMANALMEYLLDNGEFNNKLDEIEDVRTQIENTRSEMDNDPEVIENPNGERAQDYGADLNNLEEEIEVLREEADDIYSLRYDEYDHYGLPVFEYDGAEYAVGDDKMADDAAYENLDNLIDDIGYQGFTPGFVDSYIDGDAVAEDFEQYFWDDMHEQPEDYLDEDEDMELTYSARGEVRKMEETIGELKEELEEISDEIQYETLESEIEELEEELEYFKEDEDNYEFTDEAKENYVKNRMSEVAYDPIGYLKDYGWYEGDNLDRYVDKDAFIQGAIDVDGRGHTLSGYDGYELEVNFDGEWYYIYRIN